MQKNRAVLRQVGFFSVWELAAVLLMLLVFALLGKFSTEVLLGAVLGTVLAIGNFLALSITVSNALDRVAEQQNPAAAQLGIQGSSVGRMLVIAVILIVALRAGVCHPIAALLPLLFAQFALKLLVFFKDEPKTPKGGDATQ